MSLNALDSLFQSGAPGFFTRETPVGSSISGAIVSATSIQSTDYATKKPETWDDGQPKMLLAVTVASNLRTTPDDNGHRTIYIKTWGEQAKAVKQAFQNAYGATALASQALATGNIFTAAYTGEMQGDFGSPTKLYTYQIQPVNTGLDQGFTQQAPAQQAPAQQFAQPVQQFEQGPPPAWAQPAAPAIPQAPVAQALPQAPAPIQAPQPAATPVAAPAAPAAPVAPVAPVADPAGTARQLISLGIPDDQIAAATGLDPAVITALRAQ